MPKLALLSHLARLQPPPTPGLKVRLQAEGRSTSFARCLWACEKFGLAAIGLALALPLLAGDFTKATLSATHTDRFDLPAAGAIRLENSFGEVDIDGWDRPEVEVTVDRWTERLYGEKDRDEAQRRLDSIRISAQQNGSDVVISTVYPPRSSLLHPLARRSDIEIAYRIKAPRASKLIVDHNRGGVSVFDIGGDIRAAVTNGQITLTLPDGGRYAIDAQAKLGRVYSDFEGHDRRGNILGEAFATADAPPAKSLRLRVRVGDIVITKLHGPPTN